MKFKTIPLSFVLFLLLFLTFSVKKSFASILFSDDFHDIDGKKLSEHNNHWSLYDIEPFTNRWGEFVISNNQAGDGSGTVNNGNRLDVILPNHFSIIDNFIISPNVSSDSNLAFTDIQVLSANENNRYLFRFFVNIPQSGTTLQTYGPHPKATSSGTYIPSSLNNATLEYDNGDYTVRLNNEVIESFHDDSFAPSKITISQSKAYPTATLQSFIVNNLTDLSTPSPLPTPTPTPTPVPTATPVPSFSQRDPLWKNNIYDNAQSWAPGNTSFEKWGCAVTTAATVLGYYNINTLPNGTLLNPGNLNAWLKTQPDGFMRNGLVNWQAISRISKIESTLYPLLPSLEYSRKDSDRNEVISKLQLGHPVILEEPGHFVTAYQYNSGTNTINIRDPFYLATKTTLAAYGNTFLSQRQFHPSHTDLSYILVTSDSNITATIYEGPSLATDQSRYIQSPLIDQLGGSSQATSFAITELSKPHGVPYTLKLTRTAPGVGTFEILRYDTNGNPNKFEETALFGTDQLIVNIGSGSAKTTIQKQISFQTLLGDIEVGRRMGAFRRPYKAFELKALVQASERIYPRNKQIAKKLLQEVRHELEEDDDHGRHRPAQAYRQFFDLLDEDLKDAIKQLF